ncbi:MAG: bifunctional phosphoribosylaminoimidazolecarboxamide formyltransferase/inosine monophosphate cyclohydrolase [Micavibrio sp.]|nr:bifunctional phosphoribosylaminoimidazolecarboxamide formyltransferase/inosine monophosphate cyclohydrolase [Micavibrio sp.]
MTVTHIKRALLSVSDKTGLTDFAQELADEGVEILSTGGTAKALKEAGINVKDVSDHTGFPEIMGGRVKTLHPKIHGGLLGKREDQNHNKAMQDHDIAPIDMLVVNLYPFRETVAGGADFATCIENIDIGGPAMIRAAAKNFEDVTVVTSSSDYKDILKDMSKNNGGISRDLRQKLSAKAYAHTASYDSAISNWMAQQMDDYTPHQISFSGQLKQVLRYGENPHQSASLYLDGSNRAGVATAKQVQGKELSYNNLNDTDAAYELVSEFEAPTVAIIKHANPCGVASADTLEDAYKKALACDPVSAFGGIIAVNRPLNAATTELILKTFCEVVIAPSIEAPALTLFEAKDKIRVLTTGEMPDPSSKRQIIKSISGGYLIQDADNGHITVNDLKVVSDREPTEDELRDLLFAFSIAKHVKSNTIVYAKDGATVGIGAGQMSRIDSAKIAASKMKEAGLDGLNPVVASDAFFPFADGLLAAADAGVTAVIQPGGSIRDQDVIDAANDRGLAMVFTGMRHFKH